MESRVLNRRLKGWPGWLALLVVVVVVLVVGSTRGTGPQTQEDRVDAVARRVACPVCDGESVYESRNNASVAIRTEISDLVRENRSSDDQIVGIIENRYGAQVLLVPRASGFDALVWVLPAMAFVAGVAGLAVAFRRWKLEAAATGDPTDADRELVDAARRASHDEP